MSTKIYAKMMQRNLFDFFLVILTENSSVVPNNAILPGGNRPFKDNNMPLMEMLLGIKTMYECVWLTRVLSRKSKINAIY